MKCWIQKGLFSLGNYDLKIDPLPYLHDIIKECPLKEHFINPSTSPDFECHNDVWIMNGMDFKYHLNTGRKISGFLMVIF